MINSQKLTNATNFSVAKLAAFIFFSIATGFACAADSTVALFSTAKHLDIGQVDSIASIREMPDGNLVLLVTQSKAFEILVVGADGLRKSSVAVPAQVIPAGTDPSRFVAAGDSHGSFYVLNTRDRQLWMIASDGDAKLLEVGISVITFAVAKSTNGEMIYALGDSAGGVSVHLPDLAQQPLKLSEYPEKGALTDLHVRDDGDLYAYSPDQVVWHFSSSGKFMGKIGGGGPVPPHATLPGGFTTSFFDVTPAGDLWWTAGDYGPIIKITADGSQAVRYMGMDEKWRPWTAPFYQMSGLAISGENAYAVGGNMITAFPLKMLTSGSTGTSTADPRIFGLDYHLTSPSPFKLFVSTPAPLSVMFDPGNRITHQLTFKYTVFDIFQKTVAEGSVPMNVDGVGEVTLPLPQIDLPNLGWYRVDTSIGIADGTVLGARTNFIGRTFVDAAWPIPDSEVSGWNDIATHKMVSMGLHRFASNQIKDITSFGPNVAEAKRLNIPYFFQLTNKPDVKPANVDAILSNQPDLQRLEIMNEPDQQGVTPEDYVQNYLKPCYEEAHRIKPDIKVMGPAKCGIELDWMERFFKAGGGQYVDIVSVHTYERNNSMDPYHWTWKLAKLKEMMAANGCGDKPLYQTEHGYLGDFHHFINRPQWQARSLFEEYLCFDRVGCSPDQFYYYYVNEGGFAEFSAQLIDGEREVYPAALLMRTRAHLLEGMHFDSPVDLGKVGNWLILANKYVGADNDVYILMNTGVYKDVDLAASLPTGAKVMDCWGNSTSVTNPGHLSVGMYPTYVMVSHGVPVEMKLPWSGQNIAPTAKFTIDDPKAQASVSQLTNGRLEFDFSDEPDRHGMEATDGHVPLDLTATWSTPQKVDHVILYGNLSDNQYCTPVDYDIEARVNGNWKMIEKVRVETEGKALNVGDMVLVTSYANPWIFVHEFAPVTTDSIRFHFIRATFGQYPTSMLYEHLMSKYHWAALPQAVQIRELQVFSPSSN